MTGSAASSCGSVSGESGSSEQVAKGRMALGAGQAAVGRAFASGKKA